MGCLNSMTKSYIYYVAHIHTRTHRPRFLVSIISDFCQFSRLNVSKHVKFDGCPILRPRYVEKAGKPECGGTWPSLPSTRCHCFFSPLSANRMSTVGGDWSRDLEIETEIFESLCSRSHKRLPCIFQARASEKRIALRIFVCLSSDRREWKPEIDARTSPVDVEAPRVVSALFGHSLDRLKFHFDGIPMDIGSARSDRFPSGFTTVWKMFVADGRGFYNFCRRRCHSGLAFDTWAILTAIATLFFYTLTYYTIISAWYYFSNRFKWS